MKLRHILVKHEYEAQDLERKLAQGSSFEDLARTFSLCSSSKNGGSLGDLTGQMHRLDDDFRDAAELLSPGECSKPIRTKFGYHLILRDPK
ncbi:MAG: peptidylprolyl isomerase [Bdellovibrionales bacterium]|jgi:parvulin-like peptidyl-prolyl isomerase|nr:peptidylprolyl isomerase [Bdellovibrionales bacterium]